MTVSSPVCWHNGRPMGERSARILRDQVGVLEEGERVLLYEAVLELAEDLAVFQRLRERARAITNRKG